MLKSKTLKLYGALIFTLFAAIYSGRLFAETINVFTWEGYVTPDEVNAVNQLLKEKGYDYTVNVIEPWASGPEQMFKVFRGGDVDISFLTLNYIQMQGGKLANLLQTINTNSPRLSNYQKLSSSLTKIPMGMKDGQALYIPWGGGAYGIWANLDKVKELPKSVKELWDPKWEKKLSLSQGQFQPNIALALLAMGKPPFYLNDIAGNRSLLGSTSSQSGDIQKKLDSLYGQVASFWDGAPEFKDNLLLVASYGPGASAHNAAGNNWGLVSFEEGNTVWLDTINLAKGLKGKKLEAAEIFANYFIGRQVQERVVNELGMVAASSLVATNPLIDNNPDFFNETMFWPPYTKIADNVMEIMSDKSMKR